MRVNKATRDQYRELFSGIFYFYHLFRGGNRMPEPEPGEVALLLAQARLEDKTRLTNGEFSTLDLSGGQRRRLALVVSLLEERPILLWTNDGRAGP